MSRLVVTEVRNLNFGRHISRTFKNLDSSFLVIHGANESGKSTLAEFLTWAIGGPWRSFAQNSGIFRIQSGDFVFGDVSATLDNINLTLEARFKLKARGLPDDKRTADFQGRGHDPVALRNLFGGLAAEEYNLIYRLYGGTLGDIGSGVEFSELFSSFAMGSTNPLVSPRQALWGIQERCKSLTTEANVEKRKIKEIEEQIRHAMRAPEEIDKLRVRAQELSHSIDELGKRAELLASERALVGRLIAGQVHLNEKRLAEGEIRSLPIVSKSMLTVVSNLSDLEALAVEMTSAETTLRAARRSAETALVECSLAESSIRDRTFSPDDRIELVSTARRFLEASERLSSAKSAVQSSATTQKQTKLELERHAEQVGLRNEQMTLLDTVSSDLPSLSERAGRWLEQVNALIESEAKLHALNNVPETGVVLQGQRALSRPIIAVGFLLVAIAGVIHPAAGIGLATLLAASALFFQRRKQNGSPTRNAAPDNTTLVASLMRDIENHTKQAESHHALLLEGLGPLADLIDGPDTARARISSLETLAKLRLKLGTQTDEVTAAESEAADAERAKTLAEQHIKRLVDTREIPLALVDDNFEKWLAKYESAVQALESSALAQHHVDELLAKRSELLAPISDETHGLEPNAVIERVREAYKIEEQRKAALLKVRNAETAISAANLDSEDAKLTLARYDDESKLRGRLSVLEVDANAAKSERDQAISDRSACNIEIQRRSGVEVLPGLNLARGQHEEKLEELGDQLTAATVALKVFQETIDRYERENQDPVVATASALINKVVTDWGSVVFTRDEKQTPVLERADNNGRLSETVLSDGARALLYLGIRLAFAQKDAEKRGIALPLICDDPLIHFDDRRSLSALELLAEFSKTHQVMLFTCDSHTRDAAVKLGASLVEI